MRTTVRSLNALLTGLVFWNLLLLVFWELASIPCPPKGPDGLQDGDCLDNMRIGPFFKHFWAWGLLVGVALAAGAWFYSRRSPR